MPAASFRPPSFGNQTVMSAGCRFRCRARRGAPSSPEECAGGSSMGSGSATSTSGCDRLSTSGSSGMDLMPLGLNAAGGSSEDVMLGSDFKEDPAPSLGRDRTEENGSFDLIDSYSAAQIRSCVQ